MRATEPGSEFAGFRLIRELGRAHSGRVYLARQGDLADRPVALKVSADLFDEPQALAQLQHTHVVPIYSAHQVATSGPLYALLRGDHPERRDGRPPGPYHPARFGRRTGRHLVAMQGRARDRPAEPPAVSPRATACQTLRGQGFIQAILLLGARLADGLAHDTSGESSIATSSRPTCC